MATSTRALENTITELVDGALKSSKGQKKEPFFEIATQLYINGKFKALKAGYSELGMRALEAYLKEKIPKFSQERAYHAPAGAVLGFVTGGMAMYILAQYPIAGAACLVLATVGFAALVPREQKNELVKGAEQAYLSAAALTP